MKVWTDSGNTTARVPGVRSQEKILEISRGMEYNEKEKNDGFAGFIPVPAFRE